MPEHCTGSPACIRCGKEISHDEVGLTRKLINRGTTEFLCYPCMAEHFAVTVDVLRAKVAEFREMGCTLFEPEEQ